MSIIPKGYCQCGCGNATTIYQKNDARRGRVKGQPARFLTGHKSTSIKLRENIKNERKRCLKCGEVKNLPMFSIDNNSRDGRCSRCKECRRKSFDEWRLRNQGYSKRYKKSWYAKNSEYAKAESKRWRTENPEKVRVLSKQSRDKLLMTARGKLSQRMRNGMIKSLHGTKNRHHWEDLVDFTVEQLKEHIERQLLPGMTWENYGPVWHVDHKIPIAAFNFTAPGDLDFKKCWALKNLQPMWAKENWSKGAKLKRPFQPSLTINMGSIH
jgi:hypothetical protein